MRHDQSSNCLRISAWDHPNAVGTQAPAKPSGRMHAELDPRPEGGRQGGIQHTGMYVSVSRAGTKQVIRYFS